MNQIKAPWTREQVYSLNEYQKSGMFHEYTAEDGTVLIATEAGWVKEHGGAVVQDWAGDVHANGGWKKISPWI